MPGPQRRIVYKKPVEVIEGAAPARLGGVAASIAVATVTAALLGARALYDWTNDLPVGSVSDLLLDAAQRWQDAMNAAGLTRFAETVRALLRDFRALH